MFDLGRTAQPAEGTFASFTRPCEYLQAVKLKSTSFCLQTILPVKRSPHINLALP
jgi:hypothetical protein